MILERATIAETDLRLWEMAGWLESPPPAGVAAGVPVDATVGPFAAVRSEQSLQGARQHLARPFQSVSLFTLLWSAFTALCKQPASECSMDKSLAREGCDVVCRGLAES